MKKRFTVLALAFAMVLTMSASVFAADTTPKATGNQIASGETLASASLVKYLKKGDGVDKPNTGYTFNFVPQASKTITVEDKSTTPSTTHEQTTAKLTDYPADDEGNQTISYTIGKDDLGTANISGTGDEKAAVSITGTIFAGKKFKSAGEYIYDVSEEEGSKNFTIDADTAGTLTYDDQHYTLHIYVKNAPTTDDPNATAIDSITVEKEDGTKVNPTDVDPTPGTPDDDPSTPDERKDPDYKADGFTFTNNYEVIIDDKTPSDGSAYAGFGVSKEVSGAYASKTQKFPITVTVEKPLGSSTTGIKYVVGKGEEKTVNYDSNNKATFEVEIAHGEKFGVTEMALGAHVVINEPAAKYYTATTSGLFTKNNNAANQACGNTATGDDVSATNPGAVAVGTSNKGTVQAFVNTMQDQDAPTPTGIIINNLPYVLLIGLALGGIVLFSRKRRYE